jgi:hypothetical protein
MSAPNEAQGPETGEERRQFLERIGKYAAVTPPAISLMLAVSTVPAYAQGSSHTSTGPGVTTSTSPTPSPSVAPAHGHTQSNSNADDRGRTEAGDRT